MAERICTVEGCGKPFIARGWCRRHYREWWLANGGMERRTGERSARHKRELATGTRECKSCYEYKPFDQYQKNRKMAHGLSNICATCTRAGRKWEKLTGDPVKDRRIKLERTYRKRYGIGVADYDAMYDAQGGACAICGAAGCRLVVDHCHDSGRVRSLLCDFCNKALGMTRDDLRIVRAMAEYLERHAS